MKRIGDLWGGRASGRTMEHDSLQRHGLCFERATRFCRVAVTEVCER